MLLNLVTLYLIISAVLTIYLAAFIYLKGKAVYMRIVCVECILVPIYVLGYMLELHSTKVRDAVFWNYFQYLAIPFLNTFWLLMGLMYTGAIRKMRDWKVYMMFVIPSITFILRFTSHWHKLYYTEYVMNVMNEFSFMVLGKGVWYWVQSVYIVATSLVSIYIFLHTYLHSKAKDRIKYKLLLIASLIPIGSEIGIYTVGNRTGLDIMAFFLPLATILMAYSVLHYDFMEIKTLARDELFESGIDCMLVLNNSMKIIDYNKNAVSFFAGHGISLSETYLQEYKEQQPELIKALSSTSDEVYKKQEKAGESYWEIKTKILSNHEDIHGQIKTIRNVTDIIETEQSLEKKAITDELTQLNNRHEFAERGSRMLAEALEEQKDLTLLMLDIDYFKRINDTYGHHAGDEVLIGIAGILSAKFKDTGIVSRIGGEEFTVLLPERKKTEAFEYAEDVRKCIEASSFLTGREQKVTISIGVAGLMREDTLSGLMKRADLALYNAKNSGRNQVCIYDNSRWT